MGESTQKARPSQSTHEVVNAEASIRSVGRSRRLGGSQGALRRVAFGAKLTLALSLSQTIALAEARYDIRAMVSRRGDRIRFDEVIALDDDAKKGEPLRLFLYADRMRGEPPSLDEFSAERLYVGDLSRGGFEALRLRVDGCPDEIIPEADPSTIDPVRGRILDFPVCEEAKLPLRLHIVGTLHLARRYGTLGHARNGAQLGDPWYPLLIGEDAELPPKARHRITLGAEEARIFVHEGGASRGEETSWEVEGETHAPVFVLEEAHLEREVVQGVEVSFVTRRAPVSRRQDPILGDADPFDPDAAGRIIATTKQAIAFARSLGMSASPIPERRGLRDKLVVVEIEERQRLAVALPGMVAVSDRAFRLFPLPDIQRFHELGLRRRLFSRLVDPHRRAVEGGHDRPWVVDLVGSHLVDLSVQAEREPRKTPSDLVGFASFHPAVDQLLYAPKVAFRGEYFAGLDDDPDRDGADRALNVLPQGRFILEKLRDELGNEGLARAMRAHLFEGRPLREALEASSERPLETFFETWLGPKRSVAYRLSEIRSTEVSGGFEHVVAIERLGETWIEEPVTVEVRDQGGERVRGVWRGSGAHGEVRLLTRHRFQAATIDPSGRLTQDPRLTRVHPKYDDSTEHPFRPPVFNAFAAQLSPSRARPDALIDFSLRRRYDVREGFGLRLSTSARGYGGSVRYFRGLGSMVDLNSTAASASFGLSALRSDTGFGGARTPVTEAGVTLGLGFDSRRQINDPSTGTSLSLGSFIGLDREDSGESHLALTLSARFQRLFWTSLTNVVALTAGGSLAKCPALPHALPTLGSRQLLRGYETDELLGCATSFVSIEDRWSPWRGFYWNMANLAWLRRIQFVPFAAAGTVSSRETASDIFQRFYAEAGMGFRAHYDYAGIQPAVLALDLAYPLTRRDDCRAHDARGLCTSHRAPLGVWLSFEQTF